MYKIYILQSISQPGKSYVGLTIKKLRLRLAEHNNGLAQYTKAYKPWRLIYFENFYCKTCAEKREMFLKSGIGFKLRKVIIENQAKLS